MKPIPPVTIICSKFFPRTMSSVAFCQGISKNGNFDVTNLFESADNGGLGAICTNLDEEIGIISRQATGMFSRSIRS